MVRTILRLKKDSSRFKAFEAMPLSYFYVQDSTPRNHINSIYQITILIIEVLFKMPTDADASFA